MTSGACRMYDNVRVCFLWPIGHSSRAAVALMWAYMYWIHGVIVSPTNLEMIPAVTDNRSMYSQHHLSLRSDSILYPDQNDVVFMTAVLNIRVRWWRIGFIVHRSFSCRIYVFVFLLLWTCWNFQFCSLDSVCCTHCWPVRCNSVWRQVLLSGCRVFRVFQTLG